MKNLRDLPCYNQAVLPYHWAKALWAGIKYKFPSKGLRVIGVTGTNGKTTTCFMIWKMLSEAGYKTGIMTTVGWGVDEIEKQVEHMTTVDSMTLNQRIVKIKKAGAEVLVLEVTSHAMAQFRTLGIPIELAVMTNVTHDHLDYHKTFEKYRDAKRKLFKKAEYGIVNADDKSGIWFMQDVPQYLTYGIKNGKMRAKRVKLTADGVKYVTGEVTMWRADDLEYLVPRFEVETQIPGEFNVYNSLAAACVGLYLGLTTEEINNGIKSLESVEGRMNKIALKGQKFGVIVDYAHTPDAFMKVYSSVVLDVKKPGGFNGQTKDGRKGKIISLFGGAGRRDESTREERGEIGGKYSDIVIVTEDDTRDEDPAEIAEQFAVGAEKVGKKRDESLFVELDREKAIQKAIDMAEPGDLVLILGKGHEKTILRGDGPHPFEDLKVTEKAVKKKLKIK